MANHSHIHFGTTAHSLADGAVAPAVPARAEQSGHSEAAAALGAVAADDAPDTDCQCGRGEVCEFCDFICPDCGNQMDRDNYCAACDDQGDDDATLDSFYRTLGGLKGCE